MADRRRVAVSAASTARARALPQVTSASDAGPSDTGHDPAGRETSDTDPPDPACPPCSVSFVPATDTASATATGTDSGTDVDTAAYAAHGGAGAGPAQARALIRTQLRTALITGGAVMIVVTGLPLLLVLAPAIGRVRACGVPLAWAVLALGIQPVWIAASLLYLRRAERAERDLTRPAGRR